MKTLTKKTKIGILILLLVAAIVAGIIYQSNQAPKLGSPITVNTLSEGGNGHAGE